mmetsp:Transcript_18789/g.26280  ORF Transcript_18789/g.26280 Transcript_18789/m.26280 type:complete len:167 (-) Transcript_18789:97-597(-)
MQSQQHMLDVHLAAFYSNVFRMLNIASGQIKFPCYSNEKTLHQKEPQENVEYREITEEGDVTTQHHIEEDDMRNLPYVRKNHIDLHNSDVFLQLKNRKRRVRNSVTARKGRKGRTCTWCKTDKTPEWRTGPQRAPLCNACGLQYRLRKKAEEATMNKTSIQFILNQ